MKRPEKSDAEIVLEAIGVCEEKLGPEKYHRAVVALARLTGAAVGFVDSGRRSLPALEHRTEGEIGDGLVDVKAMAQWLGVSNRTVQALMAQRIIPYIQLGRTVRFRVADVLTHLQRTRNFNAISVS